MLSGVGGGRGVGDGPEAEEADGLPRGGAPERDGRRRERGARPRALAGPLLRGRVGPSVADTGWLDGTKPHRPLRLENVSTRRPPPDRRDQRGRLEPDYGRGEGAGGVAWRTPGRVQGRDGAGAGVNLRSYFWALLYFLILQSAYTILNRLPSYFEESKHKWLPLLFCRTYHISFPT